MSKMLQLTHNSWMIRGNSGTSGLLFKIDEGYLFMSPSIRLEFTDYEAVEKKFGKLAIEQRQDEDEVSQIAGYPVKHDHIVIQSEKPPLYTTGGKIIFAAGYWGLKFPNGWTIAYCPKESTTKQYDSVGPFRNRMELSNHISMLNTQANLQVIQDQ
jgi:hypothetical protein